MPTIPHHRVRLLRALGLPDGATRDDAAAVIAERSAQSVEDLVTADHGIAVRVRDVGEWVGSEQATAVAAPAARRAGSTTRSTPSGCRSPGAPKVLDLTRVLAGPVATRTLALLGCDVLRVDSPHLPELEALHLETNAGKRSTLVDLQDPHARTRLHQLLDQPTSW